MVADWAETPRAILMISGHWEGAEVAVMASAAPPMVYDYHGFPPETYQIKYPALARDLTTRLRLSRAPRRRVNCKQTQLGCHCTPNSAPKVRPFRAMISTCDGATRIRNDIAQNAD
jgi:hypothetical protein